MVLVLIGVIALVCVLCVQWESEIYAVTCANATPDGHSQTNAATITPSMKILPKRCYKLPVLTLEKSEQRQHVARIRNNSNHSRDNYLGFAHANLIPPLKKSLGSVGLIVQIYGGQKVKESSKLNTYRAYGYIGHCVLELDKDLIPRSVGYGCVLGGDVLFSPGRNIGLPRSNAVLHPHWAQKAGNVQGSGAGWAYVGAHFHNTHIAHKVHQVWLLIKDTIHQEWVG